ncbi:MAG: histone deacetylase family protein [Tepidisphaerales bacterium]
MPADPNEPVPRPTDPPDDTRARVGFISDVEGVLHDTGPHHPERPDRLRAIHRGLRLSGLLTSADPFPQFELDPTHGGTMALPVSSQPLLELPGRAATDDDLLMCHTRDHLERVAAVCASGGGVLDAGDTRVSSRSEELARRSAGAALSAVDHVLAGRVDRCLVATRPPGHHAEPGRAMGFCLYGNAALAARHALRAGLSRVAVVDFDVHHGNGTQACLEGDPRVLFISLHQHPQTCYPGTGFEWEIGIGAAKGLTLNIALPPGAGDQTYTQAMRQKVLPKLQSFQPELLILSAGFDAHRDDPLADMELSDEGFAYLTRMLVQAGNDCCRGRVVSLLEGGYDLAALARAYVHHAVTMQIPLSLSDPA